NAINTNDTETVYSLRGFFLVRVRAWIFHRNSSHDKDTISPHNRRGVTFAGEGELPFNVVSFSPMQGRVGVGCHAGAQRTSPLRPIFLGSRISDRVYSDAEGENGDGFE